MVKETGLYDLLNISPSADASEIKKAYRSCALKYHPDKLKNVKDEATRRQRTELFQELTSAYEVLSDKDQRSIYDNYGKEGLESNVVANPETTSRPQDDYRNPETLFNSLFGQDLHARSSGNNFFFEDPFSAFQNLGDAFMRKASRQHRGPERGRDIYHTLYLSLSDFYNGKRVKLSLMRKVKCGKCGGVGGLREVTCSACHGSGVQVTEKRAGGMYQRYSMTCGQCRGAGRYIPDDSICSECRGSRLVDKKEILEVKVPRGVAPGYQVVFAGYADEGLHLVPGDVVITFQLGSDRKEEFVRHEDDLLTTLRIPLYKALCGGVVSLRHISGEILHLYIDRGDLNGPSQIKVVKNRGMPLVTNEPGGSRELIGYGDLYVKFEVEFPRPGELSDKQYDLLSLALKKQHSNNNEGDELMDDDESTQDGDIEDEEIIYPVDAEVYNSECPDRSAFPE
ncbi:DEKNAAC104531 [Brettanomyces naardenensis]|uniref:DEKNAAC104531 n=1 Tax=Brettanomyces naardenensis TaxID=13370 RepID=A0A448YRP1_BRENA|nr:DEKNAAC104531 [Brettanomyces naardenensis]